MRRASEPPRVNNSAGHMFAGECCSNRTGYSLYPPTPRRKMRVREYASVWFTPYPIYVGSVPNAGVGYIHTYLASNFSLPEYSVRTLVYLAAMYTHEPTYLPWRSCKLSLLVIKAFTSGRSDAFYGLCHLLEILQPARPPPCWDSYVLVPL